MSFGPEDLLEQISAVTIRDRALINMARRDQGDMTGPTPDKVAALADAAQVLDAIGVAYALIGGVAVGIHAGVPRATLDIDLGARSTADRKGVVEAFTRAGFVLIGEFEHSVNLRHRSHEPLQIAFDPRFDPMIDRAGEIVIAGRTVRLVRKEDLIEMKRQAAADPARRRSKALRDQADVELLLGDVPDPNEGW